MVDAKRWLIAPALAAVVGIALSGCEASQDGEYKDFPKPAPETFTALFAPTAAIPVLPFPTDLLFNGTTDLTLNIPLTYSPMTLTTTALNTLDGWGTSSSMITRFSQPINPLSLGGSSVRIVELYLSNTTKAPAQGAELPPGVTSPVRRVLAPGADYVTSVSTAVDGNGQTLEITPAKPLTPSTGTTNIGYLVLVTNGVKDVNNNPAQPSADYAAIKSAPADCSTVSASVRPLCILTKYHLAIAQGVGVNPADVVLSWSFSTQSIDDTLKVLAATVPAQPIAVQATGLTTKQLNPAAPGKANIYAGTTRVPYYSAVPANANDRAPLTSFWLAAGPPPAPLDQTSRFLTRFNPVPLKRADLTIPLIVTVPNATANNLAGCPKPAAGWPIVVYQHGITRSRMDIVAVADGFADACFIVAAIDQVFHGVTDTTNPFYQAANERTFNLDLVNNTTGATGPDGKIDSSGTHALGTLVSSPPTGRDGLRQVEADLIVLGKSVANLDVTGDGLSDIDPARIHFVGHSLGGIAGAAQAKLSPNYRTVLLANAGGRLMSSLIRDSKDLYPTVRAGVLASFASNPASASFPENGSSYQQLFREVQAILDPADPVNLICNCASAAPLFLMKTVGDTTVPNSSTDAMIRAVSAAQVKSGTNAVAKGAPVFVTFTAGDHSSFLRPLPGAERATVEMQRQSVGFAASAVLPGGPFVTVTDTTVVQQ